MFTTTEINDNHLKLLDEIKKQVADTFPIVSKNERTLKVSNLRWDRSGMDVMSNIREQKDAKLKEKSVDSKLMLDVDFLEADGTVIDSRRGYTVLSMPHVTKRESYIVGGNEIQVVNQLRLRPGLYTDMKGDDEVETYLNTTAAGQYKILLDRRRGIIRFKIGSDKKVPVVAVLKALGASDAAIRTTCGELYDINVKATKLDADTTKLLMALNRYAKPGTLEENQAVIREFLASKPLDPEVTKLTVGVAIDKIDLQAIESSVRKCVEVSNGRDKPDDKESLAFKSIHSMQDYIPAKLQRSLPNIQRQIGYRMQRGDSVNGVMPSMLLGRVINDFMTTSEFTRYSDQNNPLDMSSISSTTTILGEGGIASMQSVTDKVRAVHPSHFGVIDAVHSPEGQRVGVTAHLALGAKKVGNSIHIRVFDAKTGKPTEVSVEALMPYRVAFADQYTNIGSGEKPKLKPGVTKVKIRENTDLKEVSPGEVQYIFNDAASFFSSSSNVVPFMNSNSANRVGMANKHLEQAVALAEPDMPIVQHRIKKAGKGYLEVFGENFVVKAPVSGTVKKVTKDAIIITDSKGKNHEVQIHNNYPLNSKTFLDDKVLVKKGAKVKKDDVLTESNFTNNKTIALGKNLSVAMVPYKGYNFEDGTVISHKAAQKLSSIHKEEYRIEKDAAITIGVADYVAQFPSNLETLGENYKAKYDADGVIKPKTRLSKGDIIIPAMREVSLKKTGLADLHKKTLAATFTDISAVWDKDVEGEVIDVTKGRKFVKVIVKCVEPAVVGDKLSAFAGAKGIITKILGPDEVYKDAKGNDIDVLFNPFGSFSSDTEILTEDGWKLVSEVEIGDMVMAMDQVTQEARLEEVQWTRSYEYEGDMYRIRNKKIDLLVTPDHELYSRKSSKVRHKYEKISAEDSFGLRRNFKKDCESWAGATPETFEFNDTREGTGPKAAVLSVDAHDFAAFLGLLIGDGWASQDVTVETNHRYAVTLCQSETKDEVCEYIQLLLDRLPWSFNKQYRADQGMYEWTCLNKELHEYVTKHVGVGAKNKRIPRELLSWGRPALKLMLDGLIMTDGNVRWNKKTGHYGARRYLTASKGLADDVQELMLRTGSCGHITSEVRPVGSGFSDWDSTIYTVHELKTCEPSINWSETTKKNSIEEWFPYDGVVHCLTVPSGLVYVRRAVSQIPVWCPQSVGRINPGFLLEAAAGKVAEKTGKTFYVDNFNTEHGSHLKHVQDELKKAGISDEETIKNPVTGHTIPDVLVGPVHCLKLKHKIAGKFSARGATGSAYTTLEQPQKQSGESAQKVGTYDVPSMLAGGANAFLSDAYGIKSQRNDDYWTALQLGHTLPAPNTPYVAEKFVAMLVSAGINLNDGEDGKIRATPMTDKEILRISHGEVETPSTLRSPSLTAIKRGLFDEDTTGGVGGNKFTHIKLAEPMINPLMREAVISVGNFASGVELDKILLGKLGIDDSGAAVEDEGTTGIEGVIKRLNGQDIDAEIEKTAALIPKAKATVLNKANRRLRYLKSLKELDMTAEEAYINRNVPVMPPKFRQITEMPDGSLSVADANHNYKDLMLVNQQLKELKELGVDDENLAPVRQALYDTAGASVGLQPTVTKGREFRGIIEEINGANETKYGFFRGKLVGRPQDLSARSTVIPNPKLDLDDVGIPKKMGMTIYSPFVVKRLVSNGHTALEAKTLVEDMDEKALRALEVEVEERPVLMTRAPSLHKFNMLGFKPKLTDGKAIEVNPLIVGGFNMDFDGDTAGVHVPVSEDARKEALTKLLPSKSLISPRADFVMHSPSKETVLGIYLLTTPKGKPQKVKSMQDAMAKFTAGDIKENTAVLVGKTTHCVGQQIFNDVFPDEQAPGLVSVTGKTLDSLLLDVAQNLPPEEAGRILSRVKDLGNHYVTELGYAVSLKDLEFDYKKRDEIVAKMEATAKRTGDFDAAAAEAGTELKALLAAATGNRFVEATFSSKATGKGGAVQQMVATPLAVTDADGKTIPFAIRKSYAEGHDLGSYLGTTPGARQGLIDKGLTVADTGYLSRLLVNANIHNTITEDDCGTTGGHMFDISDSELINRYGAEGELRNVLLSKNVINQYKRKTKAKQIKARAAMDCKANKGICAKCAGADADGKSYTKGYHIGALAAQSVGERATQLTLQCNAGENLVSVRLDGKQLVLSLKELWNYLHSVSFEEDGVESKFPDRDMQIWDGSRWADIEMIERHEPFDEMLMQYLDNGKSYVCQGNHPTWASKARRSCEACGDHTKELGRKNMPAPRDVYVECVGCGRRQTVLGEDWQDTQERHIQIKDTQDWFVRCDEPKAVEAAVPPVDGYLAGMYVAEGCTTRAKKSEYSFGGTTKARTKVKYSHQRDVFAAGISQNEGALRDYITERVGVSWPQKGATVDVAAVEEARKFAAWFGTHAKNKHIPSEWLGASDAWLLDFLAGVVDGDGTLGRHADIHLDTTSLLLAYQVSWIVETLGGRARVTTTPWREHSCNQGYRVTFYLDTPLPGFKQTTTSSNAVAYGERQVKDLKPVVYKDLVYDVKTSTGRVSLNGVNSSNSFHTGGAIGGATVGFNRADQLLKLPKNISQRAVLAETAGTVESVENLATGGVFVTINSNKHFVPKELGLKVKQGDVVTAGQQISQGGNIHPQDLLDATGDIKLVQNTLVDELAKAYTGQNFKRRVFETVVKPMTDRAKVTEAGAGAQVFNVHPGETLSINQIEDYNTKLKARNLPEIKYDPILLGIKNIPHHTTDFVGLLGHERLKDTLKAAPATGGVVDPIGGSAFSKLVFKNLRSVEDLKNAPRTPWKR